MRSNVIGYVERTDLIYGEAMNLEIILVTFGAVATGWIWAFTNQMLSSQRRKQPLNNRPILPLNLMDNESGVIVAEGRGHLVYINDRAREWFGLNGGDPNLAVLAGRAEPGEIFHELFADEGQATIRLGLRRIQASSHLIPDEDGRRMVVVLREIKPVSEEDGQDPTRTLIVIQEISKTITSGLDLSETLSAILTSIAQVMSFDSGEITLWEPESKVLRPVGRIGDRSYSDEIDKLGGTYEVDEGFTGWIARYRQPLLLGDVNARADVQPKLETYPYRSYIGMPLTIGDRFIGTLELADYEPHAFSHEDIDLLEAVAGQAAIAIENARLTSEQATRLMQLAGLQQLLQATDEPVTEADLFAQLHERIANLLRVDIAGVLLFDEEENVLEPKLPFYGVPNALLSSFQIPLAEGTQARRFWEVQPWWFSNDTRDKERDTLWHFDKLSEDVLLRNIALAPMVMGSRRIGSIMVGNKREGGFTTDDMRLLSIFTAQAAVVVENAKLYRREQRHMAELGGLQEISHMIRADNLEELLHEINSRIADLMGVETAGVLFYEENPVTEDEQNLILVAQKPFYGLDEETIRFYQVPVNNGSVFADLHQDLGYWYSNELSSEEWDGAISFAQIASSIGARRVLFVPLIIGNERVGLLQVADKLDGSDFTDSDARVLSISAGQAAILIDNIRLYRDVDRLGKEISGLQHIAEIAAGHETAETLFQQVLAEIVDVMGVEFGGFGILNPETGDLVYTNETVIGATLPEPIIYDVYSPTFASSVVLSRQPFRSNDVLNDPRTIESYRENLRQLGITSVISVPMIINQRVIGEFFLGNKKLGIFTEDDQRIVLTIAAQVAAALERVRLSATVDEDLQARIDQQQALDRISLELNETLLLDRILDVIRAEALRTTATDEVSVVLFEPRSEWPNLNTPRVETRLGTRGIFGEDDAASNIHRLAPIETVALEQEKTIFIEDYLGSDILAQPGDARAAIVQPISFGDQVVGLIHLFTRAAHTLTPDTVPFIERLGQQASLAVANARRYRDQLQLNERLRRRASQVHQIFRLSQMLREGATLDELMEEIANSISETVGFRLVIINVYDEGADSYRIRGHAGFPLDEIRERLNETIPSESLKNLLQDKYRLGGSFFMPGEAVEEWMDETIPFIDSAMLNQPSDVTARTWTAEDLFVIPMYGTGGRMLGFISVDDPMNARRPTLDVVELLEVFASQGAFIIENFQLVQNVQAEAESARRERDRLAQLHLVSGEIQRATDMASRLQAVADGIVSATGWQRVQITLRDERLEPTSLIHAGYEQEEADKLYTKLLPGKIWRDRLKDLSFHDLKLGSAYYLRYDSPWVKKNIFRDTLPEPKQIADDSWHPQDVLYLPLFGHDQKRIIGLIRLEDPVDGRRPTEESIQPIELFALQAAAAIENTRLFLETRRQAQIEQRLNELMEAMASTLDQSEIIQALAQGLQPLVAFTRMHIALPRSEAQKMMDMTRVELTADGRVHIFPDNPANIAKSAVGESFRTSQQLRFDLTDESVVQDYPDLRIWREEGERSTLVVPMVAGGDTIGVLRLGSEIDRAFEMTEPTNLTLIQRMANLSAVSIQNSRLFGELGETTTFNQAVVQSIQQGIVVLDADMNIQLVNNYMVTRYHWSLDAVGRALFSYRPEYKDFLEQSIKTALKEGTEQHELEVQDTDAEGQLFIRNFYTYPLRQGERVTGVVLLVEDITERALLAGELENRAEQLSALTRVSGKMTGTLKPDEVAEIILDSLGAVIPYDGVTLWQIDPRNPKQLRIEAARGFRDPGAASVEELLGLWIEIENSPLFQEMASQQKLIRVDDTSDDPRFPYGEGRVYKNWLGAPLISKGEIIGILQLEKKKPGFYNAQHEQLVLTFANQAAVALNNAQLFAETQQRAEELNRQAERLALLNRVSQDLAQSLDIENIFEITLRETARALGIEEAAAIQVDSQYNIGRLRIEYPRGDSEPTTVFSLDEHNAYNRFREILNPRIIQNEDGNEIAEGLRGLLRRDDVTVMLLVPMVISGTVVGVMRFDKVDDSVFTSEQIDLAQTIANQAAIAVQNASLFEQSVQRTYELETLFESAQSTATSLQLSDVLERVAMQMVSSVRADAAVIMLLDDDKRYLQVGEAVSMHPGLVPKRGHIFKLGDYPIRELVLREQRSVLLQSHEQDDIGEHERKMLMDSKIGLRLFAPLIVNENAIGIAQLDVLDQDRLFETGQIRLVRTLASQAAVAIENARLQSETRTQVEELSLINEVSTAVSGAMSLDNIIETLREKLPILTGAEFIYIGLYDAETGTMAFPVAVNQSGDAIPMPDYTPDKKDEFAFVIEHHAPLLISAGRQGLERKDYSIEDAVFPEAQSLVVAPMVTGSQVIGVIALRDDHDARKFDESDQRTLTTVASQVAVVIQNARLFEQVTYSAEILEQRVDERTSELEQERARIATLYEVASEIAESTLDLDRVLRRTLELVANAIHASSAVVLAIDEISDRLFVLSKMDTDGKTTVTSGEHIELRQNEGLAGWIIQNRQGIVLGDVQKDPRWVTVTEKHKSPHSVVAALLESGDDIRGVIMFYHEDKDVFNDDHLRLVTAAARQLANAMSSAELYGLIRDQAERLGAILRQEQVESTKNSAILDSVADGVMYANEQGIVRVFNTTAERILGLSSNQVINHHIRQLTGIYGGNTTAWTDAIQKWMSDPTLYQAGEYVEEIIRLEDDRVISVRLSPVNMGDQFLGTVSVFRDISREVEVDRLKSEFVATVSHELRTPMTSIKGYADLLLLGAAGEITETQARFLETIKQNADRLSILVNDLLEVSRIDQGQLTLRFVAVDVNEIFQHVVKYISGRIKDEDKPMQVHTDVPSNLPLIRADYDKIIQIVQNLADNAFNYTPANGDISLSAQFVPDDNSVIISVKDTGIGIPEDVRERIFERFFRGDEYSEVVMDIPGTGLGLAIVRELVNMHGGEIWLNSTVGEGSTFLIKIPVAQGDEEIDEGQG